MVWQYNPYALPLFFAASISIGLALFMWRRRHLPEAIAFTALLLLIAEWSLADGLEYMSTDLSSILFWDKAAYVGLVSVPVAYLIFVLYQTGRNEWLKARTFLLLIIIPAITLLLRLTDKYHHLIYVQHSLVIRYGLTILQWSWGNWFYVDALYSYALALFGIGLLARQFSRSWGVARRQSLILIFSIMVPLIASVVVVLNVVPYPVDWTSLGFTVTGVGFFWAVFRFRLFELMPVAREAIVRGMTDGVIVLDASDRLVDINPAGEQIFGSAAEVVGKSAAKLFENRGLKSECLTEQSSEFSLATNGSRRYFDLHFSQLRDKHGSITGRIGVLRDITERKRMEEELRASAERLEYIITSNPAVIYVAKPLPDLSDYFATYQSRNTFSMTGFESEEFIGEKGSTLWASRVHPDDIALYRAGTAEFWRRGHRTCEYRFLNKDGTYRWILEESNVIRDSTGNVKDIIGYWMDITEHKRMGTKLAEAQRLAAIGETTTMVGHDLRNPLQAMMSAVYLMKELIASEKVEDRKEAVELLNMLDNTVRYMDKIVSDLQDYARPVGAELVETSLPDVIKATVASVKIPGNVGMIEDIQCDSSRLMLDPGLFRRVLTNLVLNAVQAMPEGGRLTITAPRVQDSVVITVQDSGTGITPENLNKVFDPFFTTKAQGQGLGLPVCKRLIEAQGGTIKVTSEVGKGSAFTFKIPTRRGRAA